MPEGAVRFKTAQLRFYGALADFLPGRDPLVERTFDVAPSVKDTIEACGVPHPEVDLILADGEPVGWRHRIADGERIAVYPRFRTLDISATSAVHVPPLTEPRFVLDVHLGALARYLRLLGCDALLPDGADDAALAELAAGDGRALLTRDLGLLKRSVIEHGYFVRSRDPVMQCVEVVGHFDLEAALDPFTRCMQCNGALEAAAMSEVRDRIPAAVRRRHDAFRHCPGCRRLYWEGSHYRRLQEVVDTIGVLLGLHRPNEE